MRGAIWFRSDLRLDDNPALLAASNACEELIAIYVFSQTQWDLHNESNVKHEFLINNLVALEKGLQKLNIPLISINTDSFATINKDLSHFLKTNDVQHVFLNNEFGVNESERDQSLISHLSKIDISTTCSHDQVIYEPGFLKTGQGNAFSVFTPFKRRWLENFSMDFLDLSIQTTPLKKINISSDLKSLSFIRSHQANIDLWPAGEEEAMMRLHNFLEEKVSHYSETRNTPILEGTSRLSPYLALGVISPKRSILEGLKINNFEFTSGNKGICKWIDEIIWREFYRNIMHSFPRVSKNLPFQKYTKEMNWRHSDQELQAFKTGNTGFPIVDAAIRQMLEEGWMHNRLRMVVAMFFTKNMFHDWRVGERFFMKNLIDGDFASNNGGWQWSSSTGTDAAPYFRIFNPITQSQNFDPTGEFIKKFIPELRHLSPKEIHQPTLDLFSSNSYPPPILDLKSSRQRAILAFKEAKESSTI